MHGNSISAISDARRETMAKVISFILIETSTSGSDKILQIVKGSEFVTEAYIIYGDWDIIARCATDALYELTDFVVAIRKLPDVKGTKTLITTSG